MDKLNKDVKEIATTAFEKGGEEMEHLKKQMDKLVKKIEGEIDQKKVKKLKEELAEVKKKMEEKMLGKEGKKDEGNKKKSSKTAKK